MTDIDDDSNAASIYGDGNGDPNNKTFNACDAPNTFTCKTHWPAILAEIGKPRLEKVATTTMDASSNQTTSSGRFSDHAIVLLRSTLHAITSWFNYAYEENHGMKSHSKQAPEEEWIKWRDNNFHTWLLPGWKSFIQTWDNGTNTGTTITLADNNTTTTTTMSSSIFEFKVSLYVPYECLVESFCGPTILQHVANELSKNANIPVMETNGIERTTNNEDYYYCLWEDVVVNRPKVKRTSTHKYVPSFTKTQLVSVKETLEELINDQRTTDGSLSSLLDTLETYREDVLMKIESM